MCRVLQNDRDCFGHQLEGAGPAQSQSLPHMDQNPVCMRTMWMHAIGGPRGRAALGEPNKIYFNSIQFNLLQPH